MNAHAVSTQALSGTFKHGAWRMILLVLGCTVVAGAVVAAVAIRQSPGGEASSASIAAEIAAARAQHDALIDGTVALLPEGPALTVSRLAGLPREPVYRTTYLVGTAQQAAAVAAAINDSNTIRLASGESPIFDTVLLVGSDAAATAAAEAIADGNRILVGLGEPEEYVVDLRGN